MKFSLVAIMNLVSISAFANPPTQPGIGMGCTYAQAQAAGDAGIQASAKSWIPDAVSFAAGTLGTNNVADPANGFASEVYYPFSLLDKTGKVVGVGLEVLNSKCEFVSAILGSDVHVKQFE